MEWPETMRGLNFKNYGLSICIGLITSWTCWDDSIATTTSCVGFIMGTIGLTHTTSSI
jgi:hypothetical protein